MIRPRRVSRPCDCWDTDGMMLVFPSVTSLRPPASSQDWLLTSLEMGEGHKEKRKGEQGQHLGRELGREVRGTTAGIFSRKT